MDAVRVYARASVAQPSPGDACPFAGGTCQDGCWAWTGGRCEGFDMLPEGESPRDWYAACVTEVLDGE